VFCNNCGHRNPGGSNFCSSCGAPLEHATGEESTVTLAPVEATDAPDDEISVALDELPEGVGLLVVKRGPNAGSKYTLDQPVTTAGRHPDSDIFLDDITVSRRHAEFRRGRKGYTVADVGSLNGTYLNRGRIDESSLGNGDEVQIGKFRLVFLTGS
jgi:pSer/pThr/pTyr-binding forkhead associated (FHA) protein